MLGEVTKVRKFSARKHTQSGNIYSHINLISNSDKKIQTQRREFEDKEEYYPICIDLTERSIKSTKQTEIVKIITNSIKVEYASIDWVNDIDLAIFPKWKVLFILNLVCGRKYNLQ